MRFVLFAAIFAALPALPGAIATQSTSRVIMLGTGTPIPDPNAFGPATAIVLDDRLFLVDAGIGVTRRLAAAGFPRVNRVEAAFITHLHTDHTLGYPDLIFTTWIMGRRAPLRVYGPPGLKRLTSRVMDAWRDDVDVRVRGLEQENRAALAVDAREVRPGVIYDHAGVRVTAFTVRHDAWKTALAYRFDLPDRSIALSGDAAPSEALVTAARGIDVLIHEVYIQQRLAPENRPGGERWPEYMRRAHTSNVELGRIAAAIGPKLLILYHVLWMGGTEAELIAGIRDGGYRGEVAIARDLNVY